MVIKFGPYTLNLNVADLSENEILDLSLKDLFTRPVSLTLAHPAPHSRSVILPQVSAPKANKRLEKASDIVLLKAIGFSNKTLQTIFNKVIDPDSEWNLDAKNERQEVLPAVKAWLASPLPKDIWALFVGRVAGEQFGEMFIALGLNKLNSLTVLGVSTEDYEHLMDGLTDRGLQKSKVRFAIFPEGFSKDLIDGKFTNLTIGFDWQTAIDHAKGERQAQELREAMFSPEESRARAIVKKYRLPKEALNYYKFDPKLWRVLRTSAMFAKIQREFRTRVGAPMVQTEQQKELVMGMSLARMQFQWKKIPADADQLQNMKFIKLQAEAFE